MAGSTAEILSGIEQRLRKPRPGLSAQLSMAPRPRPGRKVYTEVEERCLKAGVLVLLYPRESGLHLVLIRRTSVGVHHRDQIGFPGGRLEDGEDPAQAALREAWEEIGVPAESVRILGGLTPLYIEKSDFCIYPAVGTAAETPAFRPDPLEVAENIEVPLAHLEDPGQIRLETRVYENNPLDVPFFAFGPHKIWGATAMILAEFLAVLRSDA
ncbi:MAG: NUDIX hydrolase [Candidatus Aminicenantales bacterium]